MPDFTYERLRRDSERISSCAALVMGEVEKSLDSMLAQRRDDINWRMSVLGSLRDLSRQNAELMNFTQVLQSRNEKLAAENATLKEKQGKE